MLASLLTPSTGLLYKTNKQKNQVSCTPSAGCLPERLSISLHPQMASRIDPPSEGSIIRSHSDAEMFARVASAVSNGLGNVKASCRRHFPVLTVFSEQTHTCEHGRGSHSILQLQSLVSSTVGTPPGSRGVKAEGSTKALLSTHQNGQGRLENVSLTEVPRAKRPRAGAGHRAHCALCNPND